MGSRIGYARVSTTEQKTDSQVERLEHAGCSRVYVDHGASGRLASRPEWDRCLDRLEAGDVLVCTKLDRIGRSVKNLIEVVSGLGERGVDLIVLDQGLDTTTASGKLMFHILASFSEFEAAIISERTNAGLESARARGRVGGRKPKLTERQAATVREMYDSKRHTVAEIAEAVGIHRTTVYDYLKAKSD